MEVGAGPRYETPMTTADQDTALETRRRMLLFRAQRRGFKEMDLIFGAFSEVHLPQVSAAELDRFEALLDVPDWQIWDWIIGEQAVPAAFDDHVFARLRAYRETRGAQ